MEIAPDFAFKPLPAIDNAQQVRLPVPDAVKEEVVDPNLGPLGLLPGKWEGTGFNTIWRPNNNPASDNFLELNRTTESISFSNSIGEIPNRGFLQPDITMFGIHYFQQVSDVNDKNKAGLHIEPGLWVTVPETTDPPVKPTVCRMASIPHGTTVLAQGIAVTNPGPPSFQLSDITPFPINQPQNRIPGFHTNMNLNTPNEFRTANLEGITQGMVDNPNSVLANAIAGQNIIETTTLIVSSEPTTPVPGGGVTNTAFLEGDGQRGPNADAATMTAIFWIEKVANPDGNGSFLQLQYTQTVLLNFATLSWPHVSVATLRKVT